MSEQNDQYIDQDEPVSDSQLSKIAELGVDFLVMSNEVKQMEARLDLRKKQLKHLSEVQIPEELHKVNMNGFTLANGFKLEVKPVFVVTLPKDKVDEADRWLDENGHSGMMRHHLDVALPRGIAADELSRLKKSIERFGFDCNDVKSIHFQTLAKWGREMNEEGEQVPTEIFNVYQGYKTEIKGG